MLLLAAADDDGREGIPTWARAVRCGRTVASGVHDGQVGIIQFWHCELREQMVAGMPHSHTAGIRPPSLRLELQVPLSCWLPA